MGSMIFTDNQYLKTAEEDYEAAEILFGHKYYDQVASLCYIASIKYLKAVLETLYTRSESVTMMFSEDNLRLLAKIHEKFPTFEIDEIECKWMNSVYAKANCTDGVHIIMPKQTAVEAMDIAGKFRKACKAQLKNAADKKAAAQKEQQAK